MSDSRIPLYLITGFLDSGKTTLLTDTLAMDYFNDGQRTVLLRCEDGEEEYDPQFLSQRNWRRWTAAISPSASCWSTTGCGPSSCCGT